jgi:hypothetical protein
MGKRKGTPDDIDYLFERDIIDEEDYVDFWTSYWAQSTKKGRLEVVEDFLEIAAQDETKTDKTLAGVVTKTRSVATRQSKLIGGKVVRRNARGRFSKRGKFYQAVRKGKKS